MFTGDLDKMGNLVENLRRLSEVPSNVSRRVADDLRAMIEQQFVDGTDPYGDGWAPLAPRTVKKGRTPPPLTDSGNMRASVDVKPMRGQGVSITIDDPAGFHQGGWSGPHGTGPARPILPDRGLPESWSEMIEEAIAIETYRVMARGT